MLRILFIVKRREGYGHCGYGVEEIKGGLYNSARFVVEMLNDSGFKAKVVQVVDNNDIDREVANFHPDVAIIEGLWVVPDKFDVLVKLHPRVQWVVRLHSEIPFLSQEGIAVGWAFEYLKKPNLYVGFNSDRATKEFVKLTGSCKVLYVPNWYPPHVRRREHQYDGILDIACFGAIRPLKNQLQQAVAAIEFAKERKEYLAFHINRRCDQGGDQILKNMRALFNNTPHATLFEHRWENHREFLNLLQGMDLGMAVSYSETFNIISADYVTSDLPILVSPEVRWASCGAKADPDSVEDIIDGLKFVTGPLSSGIKYLNERGLRRYVNHSQHHWTKLLNSGLGCC